VPVILSFVALYSMLGVSEIEAQSPHKHRFFYMPLNCAEVTPHHEKWEDVLKEVRDVYSSSDRS